MDLNKIFDFKLRWFDRKGNPISPQEAALHFIDNNYKILKHTVVGKYLVSTVWLGLNYNYFNDPPLIFETMIFLDTGDDSFEGISGHDLYMDRYSTEEEAFAGHEKACEIARTEKFDE